MVSNKKISDEKVFVSFYEENDHMVAGYFELVEKTPNYIVIRSLNNLLTIPYHRLIKLKEKSIKEDYNKI